MLGHRGYNNVHELMTQDTSCQQLCATRPWLARVFCGTAWGWHRSHLEDFADFYRTGKHREDEAFADMEAADLRSGRKPPLQHNIAGFGFLKRHMDDTTGEYGRLMCAGQRASDERRPAGHHHPPTAAAVGSKGEPHDRRGVSGRPRGRCRQGGCWHFGSELERRASYSVFYGQKCFE
jgi:hypothetical protein